MSSVFEEFMWTPTILDAFGGCKRTTSLVWFNIQESLIFQTSSSVSIVVCQKDTILFSVCGRVWFLTGVALCCLHMTRKVFAFFSVAKETILKMNRNNSGPLPHFCQLHFACLKKTLPYSLCFDFHFTKHTAIEYASVTRPSRIDWICRNSVQYGIKSAKVSVKQTHHSSFTMTNVA